MKEGRNLIPMKEFFFGFPSAYLQPSHAVFLYSGFTGIDGSAPAVYSFDTRDSRV